MGQTPADLQGNVAPGFGCYRGQVFATLGINPARASHGCDRNVGTNTMLRKHGIEVTDVLSSELGRGRDGSRCPPCPIERDPA